MTDESNGTENQETQAAYSKRSQWAMRVEAVQGLLATAAPGQVITYAALAQCLVTEDRDEIQSIVTAARKLALVDPGYVFRPVENVGYVRLTDSEIATRVPAESRAKMRRRAARTTREIECVKDFSKLTTEERRSINTGIAVNSVVATVLQTTRVQKVLKTVSTGEQLRSANSFLTKLLTGAPNEAKETGNGT